MINPNDITTVRVDQLVPSAIGLTDLLPFETIADQALKNATFQDLVNFINIHSAALQFEVKRMSVTQAYIDANFDITGLGINLCTGFAICNGQNGTENLDGLVGVGFGSTQNNIGGFGGSRDSVVVAHSHGLKYASTSGGTKYPETPYIGDTLAGNMYGTETVGVSGTNKNMQPYIVQLYMMKL